MCRPVVDPADEHAERDVVGDVQDARECLGDLLTLERGDASFVLDIASRGFEEHAEEHPRQNEHHEAEQGHLTEEERVLGGECLAQERPSVVEVEPAV